MHETGSPELFICTNNCYDFKINLIWRFLSQSGIILLTKKVGCLLLDREDLHTVFNMTLGPKISVD